jgi:microcystin degradation protein MlrC
MRAAIVQLFHEANAFKPETVTLQDFEHRHALCGEAVRERFAGTRNWIGGVLQALDQAGIETEIGFCTAAHPGGAVDEESFRRISRKLVDSIVEIQSHGTIDLVCMLLHGALVVNGTEDPESALVRAVRALVGNKCIVACALDFHANPGSGILDVSDIVIAGVNYPHDDTHTRGTDLVRLALTCRPENLHSWHFRLPLSVSMPRQVTLDPPFSSLVARCKQIAKELELDDVALLGGFPYAPNDRACTSVLITGRDQHHARQAFLEVATAVWQHREELLAPIPSLRQIKSLRPYLQENRTLVIADVGDNPGAGGMGDEASLLEMLLETEAPFAAGILVAPSIVEQAWLAGVGKHIHVGFGTKYPRTSDQHTWYANTMVMRCEPLVYRNQGPMMAGEALDGGRSAVLRIGQGMLLVATGRIQAYDVQAFLSQNIDLSAQRFVAIKTSAHFRSSYMPYASAGIMLVDSLGWAGTEMARFDHHSRRKKILPLQKMDAAQWSSAIQNELSQHDSHHT